MQSSSNRGVKISLTIDGQEVRTVEGSTVLEAAQGVGIYIPTLCHYPGLPPYGACRLCIVEIEGMRGYPTACTTPVAPGMVVRTQTAELAERRRQILQLILSEHPYTCLVCADRQWCGSYQTTTRKSGVTTGCQFCPNNNQCDLQDLVHLLGIEEVSFPIAYRNLPVEGDPFFERDYNLCILCGRCVRACQEVRGIGALAFTFRGNEALVGTAFGRELLESGCQFCGACVDVCPTGSLAERRAKWEGKADRSVTTVCPYCSLGCSLDLGLKAGRIIRTRPSEGGINRGQLCVKGRFGVQEIVHSADRLHSPLVKRGGRWVETGWKEAIEEVAKRFSPWVNTDKFALISSPNCTNEDGWVLQKFARTVMGTNQIGFSPPYLHPDWGCLWGTGLEGDLDEVCTAGFFLCLGTDFSLSHGVVGVEVRKALSQGAHLLSIGYRGANWQSPPGGEVSLILAIAKLLCAEEGMEPPQEGFAQILKEIDLSYLKRSTGISKEEVEGIARLIRDHQPLVALIGPGVTSFDAIRAAYGLIWLLRANGLKAVVLPLFGANNFRGTCDMGLAPGYFPGLERVEGEKARVHFERLWGGKLNPVRGEEILPGIEGQKVKALYLVGDLPPLSFLKKLELLVVQAIYPSKVAEYAQIILPAASFAEVDGTFTNFEGRVQRVRRGIKPPGRAKPDWWICSQIAQRMGASGFNYSRASQITAEIAGAVPGYQGVSPRRLRGKGVLTTLAKPIPKPPKLPNKRTSQPFNPHYPFTLVAVDWLFGYRGASLSERVKGMELIYPARPLQMNEEDMAKLGLGEGSKVKLSCRQGELHLPVSKARGLPSGVVSIESNLIPGPWRLVKELFTSGGLAVRIEPDE